MSDALVAALPGADHREFGGMSLDIVRAGDGRVKRMIYPAGFRWSERIRPIVGTDTCEHVHVGFLARGEIEVTFPDGCATRYTAPAVLAIEPGHDALVGGDGAVIIEFDFEGETISRLGMPDAHRHD
ncbi:MAG: hypothetical protein AB7H88_10070 [Vicinamibacterales bacterium]